MLKRSYAALGRLAHRTLGPFLKFYIGAGHVRVRALLITKDQEILLVRSWLGHQHWTLPGGGIRRGENPALAARREVLEETGIRVDDLQEIGTFINADSRAPFTVQCFLAVIDKQDFYTGISHRLEMLDVGWFHLKKLPNPHSPTLDRALQLAAANPAHGRYLLY